MKYRIRFEPSGRTVEADPDTFPLGDDGEPGSILDIALGNGVTIEHACGGAGACGTCHVMIEKGMANLSPSDDDELDVVELAPGNTPSSRLACKAVVRGDVTVRIPQWSRHVVSEERSPE
jgi:2Fe-2S ferredoxin